MDATKSRILATALRIYNAQGVASTSIRQMAKEVGISHSNLIYHFPSHEEIVLGLHDQLLQKALNINGELRTNGGALATFLESTRAGFEVAYNYRFLFLELPHLCATYPRFKQTILDVETVRSGMYQHLIENLVADNIMRPEAFTGEYAAFIQHIKLFSDHWIVSSAMYDNLETAERIEKYALLLIHMFYPYLTPLGKEAFHKLIFE